jgi:hypothetical protein
VVSIDAATGLNSKKRKKKKKTGEMEMQLLPESEREAKGARGRVIALGGPIGERRAGDRGAEGSAQSRSGIYCIQYLIAAT